MNVSDYYFHTILKDGIIDKIYEVFEEILRDGKLKSQKLLCNNETKFNGVDYISLAEFVNTDEYKVHRIYRTYYSESRISKLFNSYEEYLDYIRLDDLLEEAISMKSFFEKNNTSNKREYYNYLDSISRRYPVDIKYLYKVTNDEVYKYILDMIDDDVLYCNKSEYCFESYIRNSKGIIFVFPKNIDVTSVNVIPNLPFEIENELVKKITNMSKRYSNQIGEVQKKDYIDIECAIGVIIGDSIDKQVVRELLNKYNLDIGIYKLEGDRLVEL